MVALTIMLYLSCSQNVLYVHIMSLGNSYLSLGLIGTANFIAQTLAYFALPGLTRYCGYELVTWVGFVAIGVRYIIYYEAEVVWWLIIADCFKGITLTITLEINNRDTKRIFYKNQACAFNVDQYV